MLCHLKIATNEKVLPMVGGLKNLRVATEVHYLFEDEKFILMFNRVFSAGTEAEKQLPANCSNVQPHYWQYSCYMPLLIRTVLRYLIEF